MPSPPLLTGTAVASATVAATTAAAKVAKPAVQRKCTICGAVGLYADNQAFSPCYTANKANVVAETAALGAKKAARTQL